MKSKFKILSVFSLLFIMLTLVGCGNNTSNNDAGNNDTTNNATNNANNKEAGSHLGHVMKVVNKELPEWIIKAKKKYF